MNETAYPTLEYVVDVPVIEFTEQERQIQDEVNRRVAAGNTLDEVMSFLFDVTQPVCACDRLGLAFVDESGERIVAHWCRAMYEPVLLKQGYAEDVRGSSLEAIIESGTPRIINDLEAYLAEHPESRSTRVLVREGVRSSMTCPLVVEGRPVGVFFRSSRERAAYTPRQVAMHLSIAERLSQAVEKACRIEQLEEANRSYMEMLGFASHELKSPLAAIITGGNVLLQGYLGDVDPKHRQAVERMVNKAQYLLNLTREYLDLARLEGGELTPSFVSGVDFVSEVVGLALDVVDEPAKEKHITVKTHLEMGAAVDCDPELMKIVVVNLLSNAVKYGVDNGQVDVTFESSADGFEVRVRNTGPGFPESEKPRLFRKFSRLQTPELRQRKGTGVGLYTCWRVVKLHGGTIRADSRQGEWAEFAFTIPQPLAAKEEQT